MNNDVKSFLKSTFTAKRRLDSDRLFLLELEQLVLYGPSLSDGMPRANRSAPDSDADLISDIVDLRDKVEYDARLLVLHLQKVNEVIGGVKDERLKLLLQLRYLNLFKFEQIAVRLGYSWRQTHRMHAKALAAAKEVFEKMS